jgi:hypothetical protein
LNRCNNPVDARRALQPDPREDLEHLRDEKVAGGRRNSPGTAPTAAPGYSSSRCRALQQRLTAAPTAAHATVPYCNRCAAGAAGEHAGRHHALRAARGQRGPRHRRTTAGYHFALACFVPMGMFHIIENRVRKHNIAVWPLRLGIEEEKTSIYIPEVTIDESVCRGLNVSRLGNASFANCDRSCSREAPKQTDAATRVR